MTNLAHIIRDFTIALAEPHDAACPASSKTLAASVVGSSLVFVSGAVLNVALSAVGHDLRLDAAQMQWLVNAELLPLAALSIVGGSLGDRFGRRRVFLVGVTFFMLSSLVAAFATGYGLLLACRLLQGVGDALILPNGLTIIGSAYTLDTKSRAVGIWSASVAVASALAPAVAGYLLEDFTWRSVFLMNMPIGVIALWLSSRWIPADGQPTVASIDFAAAVISTAALGCFGWGFTALSNRPGEAGVIVVPLIVGAALIVGLVFLQRARGERAMLPPTLFQSTTIFGLSIYTLLLYGAFSVVLTLVPYTIIRGASLSTVVAGAAFVPLQILMALISPLAPQICARIGHRYPLVIGAMITAVGCFVGGISEGSSNYWTDFFPAIAMISLGLSIAIAPLTTLVLTSVRFEHSGIAAGFNGAMSRAGSLLAVALLGGVLRMSGPPLVESMHGAMWACAAACVLAAVSVLWLVPKSADI